MPLVPGPGRQSPVDGQPAPGGQSVPGGQSALPPATPYPAPSDPYAVPPGPQAESSGLADIGFPPPDSRGPQSGPSSVPPAPAPVPQGSGPGPYAATRVDSGSQSWPQGPAQPGPGQFGSGQMAGPGQFGAGPPPPRDATMTLPGMPAFDQGGPGGPGRFSGRLRMPRTGGPLLPAIGIAALIVVVAAVIVAVRGNSGPSAGATQPPAPVTATSAPAQPSPTANPQQKKAATQLAVLLPQSGSDRGDVNHAYSAVEACKTLPADQRVFTKAAANRQKLLTKLHGIADISALNPSMIQALTGAWTASAQADTDYARWAGSLSHRCKKGKTLNNPNLKASYGPDSTATTGKQTFTQLWNPLAAQTGLPSYQPGDL